MEGENMDVETYELEGNLEPLTRTRSNTWPMPQPEGYVDGPLIDGKKMTCNNESTKIDISTERNNLVRDAELPSIKKKSSRRNAWGCLSYAELITLAITSAKDQRLTLSQIYAWMVSNITFFKDKGGSNSSAGWKNSIRHNLSLHNRFVRVPNEGAGKSSWWMLNPNAASAKSTRRRTASMEVGKYEKKRARARKRMEMSEKENSSANVLSSLNGRSSRRSNLNFVNNAAINKNVNSFAFPSRITYCASSGGKRLSPIPAISDEIEWSGKYSSYTFQEAAPVRQTPFVQPLLNRQTPFVQPLLDRQSSFMQPILDRESPFVQPMLNRQRTLHTSLSSNAQTDLSSMHYQMHTNTGSNDQKVAPATYIPPGLNQYCVLHHQAHCTCHLHVVQVSSGLPTNFSEPCALLESKQVNLQNFTNNYENGEQFDVKVPQPILRPMQQEPNQFNSLGLQIDNGVENQTSNAAPLVRNNSLLDDIDEIIKREQCSSVDALNDYMPSVLYVSQNIKQSSCIR